MGFVNNSVEVKGALNESTIAWLYEASGELQSRIQRNSRVDTGQTKNSYTYVVDEGEGKSTIGSPEQNAIWEEFGTGIYAVGGDGRKTPWFYVDRQGQGHYTKGKSPNRPMERAYTSVKKLLQSSLENAIKEGMKE